MQRFVDGDRIAAPRQLARADQTGRPCADDRDRLRFSDRARNRVWLGALPVGDEPLQMANRHRLKASPAFGFALGFQRADAAASGRQRIRRSQHARSPCHVADRDVVNELANRDADGIAVHAHRILAAQTAFRLELRMAMRVGVDFLEIVRAHNGVLHRHRCLVRAFDRHDLTLFATCRPVGLDPRRRVTRTSRRCRPTASTTSC